ncbi:hypothetical protein MRX96_024460 [Rhipicephalus microplus]
MADLPELQRRLLERGQAPGLQAIRRRTHASTRSVMVRGRQRRWRQRRRRSLRPGSTRINVVEPPLAQAWTASRQCVCPYTIGTIMVDSSSPHCSAL